MHWAGISLHFLTVKMGQTVSSETLVFNLNQTPGNCPKEDNFNTMNHGESLKLNMEKECEHKVINMLVNCNVFITTLSSG
jgi:hypothetical protein